jgi:DNA primase
MDFGDHENKVYLNYYRNPKDKDIIIKIYSIKNFQGNIQSMLFNWDSLEKLLQIQQKFIFISSFDFDENYISYFKTFDESYKVYYSEYNQEKMNISDIININKNYFKDISNKLIELDTKKIHIFISDSKISGKLL